MSAITWAETTMRRTARCRVCNRQVDAMIEGRITALAEEGLEIARCPECGSIDLLDSPRESSPTDESVDAYIEGGAGIGTIAGGLARVDPASVVNVLDVGCGFGFSLDVGRFLYGWDPVGIEPSRAGERGAVELDLDIRSEFLTEGSSLGRRFDLIHSSEVIEHVPDPLNFLRVLRQHITDDGCVVLTTPAAEIVSPASAASDVLSAISPGFHVFLASAAGLERLLRDAGFASIDVTRRHGTLHAIASVAPNRTFPETHQGADIERTLEPYYRFRDQGAPAASALANGMIVRYVRAVVSRGDFAAAVAAVPRLVDCMRQRHQFDLDRPQTVLTALAEGRRPAWHLAGASFALGMIELLHHGRRQRAATYFEVAREAVSAFERVAGILDLDSVDLRTQSAFHHALALVGDQPDRSVAIATTLSAETSSETGILHACRIFVELVGAGQYGPAEELETAVGSSLQELADRRHSGTLAVVVDTLFSLGILALNTGRAAPAKQWFQRCLQIAETHDDAHSVEIAGWSRTHIALAIQRGATGEPSVDPWPAAPAVHHAVDVYWCDGYGTFLEGWAWVDGVTVDRYTVRVGDATRQVEPRETPHLQQYWPAATTCHRSGFAAYVPGRPTGSPRLTLHTASGDHDLALDLPATPLPEPRALTDTDPVELLKKWIAEAPAGPVLALGIRAANPEQLERRRDMFGDRVVVGMDIHPGLGVDVVGDVHTLSQHFPPGHFSAVFSTSLLEHVAVPWLVAAECATVLRRGGLAVHAAPWTWPTHAEPNDFWRFSAAGLEQLFGAACGFRVLDSGSCAGAVVVPAPNWRQGALKMATTSSPALTWVVAERLDGPPPTVVWPYDPVTGADAARRYPLDGLAVEDISGGGRSADDEPRSSPV